MSFDYPQEPRRRKKGGISGIMMLLFIGLGIFVFMNMRGAGGGGEGGAIDQGQRPVEGRAQGKLDPRTNRELQDIDAGRRIRDEMLGAQKSESAAQGNANTMPSGRGTSSNDWSIEDVDGKKKSAPAAAAKKTQGEDGWSIEEVPTTNKSGTGLQLNNEGGGDVDLKEKSDWSVEDVDPKAKKTTEGDWSVEEVEGGGK